MTSGRKGLRSYLVGLLSLVAVLGFLQRAQAQPTIVSVDPPDGAIEVSTATAVIFTFSTAMNTNAIFTLFTDPNSFPIPTTLSWSSGNTVLTCAPMPSFPANTPIGWNVFGVELGFVIGGFTTGSGGGSGTNVITTFSVGKTHHYNQTSAGAPVLDATTPYGFSGAMTLASNRTATAVTLTLPTAAVSNLVHLPPPQAEIFLLVGIDTSLSTFDATFPAGNYEFEVTDTSSNQTVNVNLPMAGTMPQPGVPHVNNYVAAQAVNPNQAFVVGWDAFPGGTAADFIDVDIGPNFGSPHPGLPGALTGTAVNFTIPAGTLQANAIYNCQIGFFRFVGATNSSYATAAFRATYTEFSLITTSPSSLLLTNATRTPSNFSFDVTCSVGQTVTVEYKTNLAAGLWQTLLTTNSPVNRFRATAPQASTNRAMFFRARNGS